MQSLLRPLPPLIAKGRLKINLFSLILLTVLRIAFPPYLALRRGLIWVLDEILHLGLASTFIWLSEIIISIIFIFNASEALYSIYFPSPTVNQYQGSPIATTPRGLKMVPTVKSSPLTRAYPTPDRASSSATQPSTSTPRATQSSSTPRTTQTYIQSTPSNVMLSSSTSTNRTQALQTSTSSPFRSNSPLTSSTSTSARLFNLPPATPPHPSGLFYDTSSPASPSRLGTPNQQSTQGGSTTGGQQNQSGSGSGPGGDFVLVEREEKEWADNVWKGVAGKRGPVGRLGVK